ncbi:ketopantoate reductase family protein [Alicyclobacillus sp. ALC3]|uniref:ketopantoate reductase family protein n=1 Tax=Alicyclobacillus sp. ALC3 TaxID=2796143 RepID=UPI0023781D57|nr:2-dehydropantoate 2-reductase N-terminal domain-containing protein [Alicyclobacillus sp. ALC3]WDL98558.1 NAD(P)-binding domain-containing protein [Alicyclobacillus sp. ALC3]
MDDASIKTQSSLSIAILGVGRIGSTFAYQLSKAGHQVTVIARTGSLRLEQLQRDNGIVLHTGERAEVRVADSLDEQTVYDLVIVTTLAHQVNPLLPVLQRSRAKCVHFMFVNFEPERLRDALGRDRCTFGMPAVMATLDEAGRLKPTINSRQKTMHSDQRWVDLFSDAGVPSVLETEMLLWLSCHVPFTVAMESVSVAGHRRGGGATWVEAMNGARGMHAGFTIVKRLKSRLYPRSKSVMASLPVFLIALLLWFVSRIAPMRELMATGLNECRALADKMAVASDKMKPTLPSATQAVLKMKPVEESG